MRRPLLGCILAGLWLGHSACQIGDRPTPTSQPRTGPTRLMAAARDKDPSADAHSGVRVHAKPKPLPPGAVTHEWTSFLGPTHNAISTETKLLKDWPTGGPPLIWELRKGTGYTSPAIYKSRLVYFYRQGDQEIVDCLHPESGDRYWTFRYPTSVSGPLWLQQWSSLQSGDRRESRLYLRGRRKAPLPRFGVRCSPLETPFVTRVPGAPGLLWSRFDTPGRGEPVDRQCGCPRRALGDRSGQTHRQARLGNRRSVGPQLCFTRSGHGWRKEENLCLRRR